MPGSCAPLRGPSVQLIGADRPRGCPLSTPADPVQWAHPRRPGRDEHRPSSVQRPDSGRKQWKARPIWGEDRLLTPAGLKISSDALISRLRSPLTVFPTEKISLHMCDRMRLEFLFVFVKRGGWLLEYVVRRSLVKCVAPYRHRSLSGRRHYTTVHHMRKTDIERLPPAHCRLGRADDNITSTRRLKT